MDLLLLIGELALARAKHNIYPPDGEGPGNTHSVADQIGLVVVVGTGGSMPANCFQNHSSLCPAWPSIQFQAGSAGTAWKWTSST